MQTLEKLDRLILFGLIFLYPIVVLPFFPNPFSTSKLFILVVGIAIVLIIKVIKTILSGNLSFAIGKFDLPVVLIALTYIVAGIIATPNKYDAFLLPGTASFAAFGAILYFLVNQQGDRYKSVYKFGLLLSAAAYSFMILLAITGILKLIPQLPNYLKDPAFNPGGSTLATILFLLPIVPMAIHLIMSEKETVYKVIAVTALGLITFATLVTLFDIMPGRPTTPQFPTLSTSWIIAAETLKVSPFVGVGPGNYISAFNVFRPVSYNQSPLWQLRFSSATNLYLTLLTETGLLGLASIIILLLSFGKTLQSSKGSQQIWNTTFMEKASVLVLLILLLVTPASEIIIVFMFLLLAFATRVLHRVNFNTNALSVGGTNKLPATVASLPLLLFAIWVLFIGGRSFLAETKFQKALIAIGDNDGKSAYDLLRNTIQTNPDIDRYHTTYAQINIALANAIGQKDKTKITEQDRNTASTLIQQGIREGKVGVQLNIQRAANWELLASIYRSIIPIAKDADQFALQTYSQAVALDPLNPALRLSLGGLYYSAKNWDAAIDTFKLAVLAKPDYANAHYNLALAYKEKGDNQKAISEMQAVISLVKQDSEDYKLAKTQLDSLQQNKEVKPQTSDNLTPPNTPSKQEGQPEIKLPADTNPPATIEPSASPSPTPIPAP